MFLASAGGGGSIIETRETSLSLPPPPPQHLNSGRNSSQPITFRASFVLSVDVMGCYVLIVIGPMIYGRFMIRPHTQTDGISSGEIRELLAGLILLPRLCQHRRWTKSYKGITGTAIKWLWPLSNFWAARFHDASGAPLTAMSAFPNECNAH